MKSRSLITVISIIFIFPIFFIKCSGDAIEEYLLFRDSNPDVLSSTGPYVLTAFTTDNDEIRLIYSEPLVEDEAVNILNYELMKIDTSEIVGIISIVKIDEKGATYRIKTASTLNPNKIFKLEITGKIHDIDDGVELVEPKFASFLGNEQLKIASASCLSVTSMMVVFNKPVKTGAGDNGGENTLNYKFAGPSDLGAMNSAVRGNLVDANEVTISHSGAQKGVGYMVIGANGVSGDGFDEGTRIIQSDLTPTENLQNAPNDRITWNGCGEEIDSFDEGPIATDPFGDDSNFGYLTAYKGKLYIGPNTNGNSATRMEPTGKNPINVSFSFEHDGSAVNSTGTHDNAGGTDYVTMGHSGCTEDSIDINSGCGPDNENGRGLFISGLIGGSEHLFITGSRNWSETEGNNDYLYWTADADNKLDFKYIDLSYIWDLSNIGGNKGTESISIFNGAVYWMQPGDRSFRPYMVKLNLLPYSGEDIQSMDVGAADGTDLRIRETAGIGDETAVKPNFADRIGGTLYGFKDRLYLANSGSVYYNNAGTKEYRSWTADGVTNFIKPGVTAAMEYFNDGGIVMSTNNDPGFGDWADITPELNPKFTNFFSKIIDRLQDLIPADRPIPAFAEYKGRLFMIRNACTVNMYDTEKIPNPPATDDRSCSAAGGIEVPQLWKCSPEISGNAESCDPGDWALVAENGETGMTNFGNANNKYATILITNGDYLYVGFDNPVDGVEIWRTSADNPAASGDFEQVGSDGLGNAASIKQIYSGISIKDDSTGNYYIYISAGAYTVPVAVYRDRNN